MLTPASTVRGVSTAGAAHVVEGHANVFPVNIVFPAAIQELNIEQYLLNQGIACTSK